MRKSADQHYAAAQTLHNRRQKAVAAYLFGLAAECAVKAIMVSGKMPGHKDRSSAYYAHFPGLRLQLQDVLQGRVNFYGLRFATKDDFFAGWDISIRYAESGDVLASNRYDRWFENAKTAINAMAAL